ncbi:hypothetical protein [Cellulosilyticum sp. I15G10I2]|uniref:hypothetical protein n=1 Tax=Cellulosilyticum sp. I15G10I2 TaxID=1892843 RepID=UPI00085BEA80|nr:hypothetical protein [Cellulosilyticum sp. I15G10I2]
MNWLRKWMYGRYGMDQLSIALIIVSLCLSLLSSLLSLSLLSLFAYPGIMLAYFRILSKNYSKRQKENLYFLKFWTPLKTKYSKQLNRLKDMKTYRYYKCAACGQTLRVPKGRGNIRIICPKCKNEFSKRT